MWNKESNADELGSMQSPKLLELSGELCDWHILQLDRLHLAGIGNKTLLEGFGIDTLLDLPQVGENLQVCSTAYTTSTSWRLHVLNIPQGSTSRCP
jgi:hypothetical protein